MFTGIVSEIGKVVRVTQKGKVLQYALECGSLVEILKLGASVAVDGVCQTVARIQDQVVEFEAIDETLQKTTLKYLKAHQKVHLEPAMSLGDRLDGHLVYGHVDGMGKVVRMIKREGRYDVKVELPKKCKPYILEGGSICLSGVSLTIFEVDDGSCSVSLIPETLKRTNFDQLEQGNEVNVEVDFVGKWLEKLSLRSDEPDFMKKMSSWGYD